MNHGRPKLKDGEKTEIIGVKIPKSEKDTFRKLCEFENMKMSERVQMLIRKDLSESLG